MLIRNWFILQFKTSVTTGISAAVYNNCNVGQETNRNNKRKWIKIYQPQPTPTIHFQQRKTVVWVEFAWNWKAQQEKTLPDKTAYNTDSGSYFFSYSSFKQTRNPVLLMYLETNKQTQRKQNNRKLERNVVICWSWRRSLGD